MASFNGSVNIKNEQLTSLVVNGSATLHNVRVTGQIKVNGAVNAYDCTLFDAEINGSLSIKKSVIHSAFHINGELNAFDLNAAGLCSVHGQIKAYKSTFQEVQAIGALSFYDSTIKNIKVKSMNSFFSWLSFLFPKRFAQVVDLHNTQVDGDIVFEDGKGTVYLNGNAEVRGSVIGGIIKKIL